MDRPEREFFRAERKRRRLRQVDVAREGHVEQSTVSKIEIEPKYEPSLSNFKKAIRGLGMTVAEFYAQIEGGSPAPAARDDGLPQQAGVERDEATSYADEKDRITATVVETLAQLAAEARTRLAAIDHRQTTNPRPRPTDLNTDRDHRLGRTHRRKPPPHDRERK